MKGMGSLTDIISMLPGVNKSALNGMDIDEKKFYQVEAIITSMTKKERTNPDIINSSRKKRIADGSGVKVQDVNVLLKQFEQMRKMMKQLSNPKALKRQMRGMGGLGGFFR